MSGTWAMGHAAFETRSSEDMDAAQHGPVVTAATTRQYIAQLCGALPEHLRERLRMHIQLNQGKAPTLLQHLCFSGSTVFR